MTLVEAKNKIDAFQSEVEAYYKAISEETLLAVSEYIIDEIDILKLRVSKIEDKLAYSGAFSLSTFGVEMLFTMAMGPLFANLVLSPIVNIISRRLLTKGFLYQTVLKRVQGSLSLDKLNPAVTDSFEWDELSLRMFNAVSERSKQIALSEQKTLIDNITKLSKDTLGEAFKQLGKPLSAAALGKVGAASTSTMPTTQTPYATTIASKILQKFTSIQSDISLVLKCLKNEIESLNFKDESTQEYVNTIFTKIEEILKGVRIEKDDDIALFRENWRIFVRQYIWVNVIGSDENIATDISKARFSMLKHNISKSTIDILITRLPSSTNSFVQQVITERSGESLTEAIVLSDVNRGATGDWGGKTRSRFSHYNSAVEKLMRWIREYNLRMNYQGDLISTKLRDITEADYDSFVCV